MANKEFLAILNDCDDIIECAPVVEGSIWSRYLRYLVQWAIDHSEEAYGGMTPACYDEWLSDELPENEI